MATVQRLACLGLPVECLVPTAKSNAEEWPQLAQRFANGTVAIFAPGRLRKSCST